MSDLPPEELVKALRLHGCHSLPLAGIYGHCRQAAALIERLEARVAELEGALKPFAMFPETGKHGGKFVIAKGLYEDMKSWWGDAPRAAHLHLSDFRKASKSLAQGEG